LCVLLATARSRVRYVRTGSDKRDADFKRSQLRIGAAGFVNFGGAAGVIKVRASDTFWGEPMPDDPAAPDPERIATQADFGRELTALRERAGLKIREVAKAAKIPVSTTGDYFSGRHLPADRQQLLRILEVCEESDAERIAAWETALTRARRPPGRRTSNPYRGLARFEAADARWFFGREDVTELLVALAAESSPVPLMLVGPSGAGKSSLLRAGLLPRLVALAEAAPGTAGPVTVFEPTASPLEDLKSHLAELAAVGALAEGTAVGALAEGTAVGALAEAAEAADGRPAVIVDQFEAVFTLCQDEAQRRDFVTELCELARSTLVILALRADFYDHAIRYPGLAAALQSRQVVLGPMTAGQVHLAITEPARLARVNVEEGLVGLLLADLAPQDARDAGEAYEPGALPLLSHAMMATWEHSRGSTLAIADYVASGGIKDALTQTAERAYGSLSAPQQQIARRLFLRLVHVADDLPPSRATVELGELREWGGRSDGDAERVLATFVHERMITVDADAAQITHDALLVAWPRLRSWIDSGTEGLRTRRRITQGARSWDDAGRESAALWRGSQLAIAREWAADEDNRSALPALAAEFVDASIAEEGVRRRAERRRARRLQAGIAMLTALAVVVAGLVIYVFQQRRAVTTAQHLTSAGEAALEADQVRGQDPPLAAQLSVSAYGLVHTQFTTASLLESSGTPSAARILDSTGIVQWAALSPDHRLLAAAGADGTLRLWNVARPGHPSLIGTVVKADLSRPLYVAAFSPDGKVLAAAGAGQVVHLWDVSDPARPRPLGAPLTGPTYTVYSIAFSPDGRTLAAGSADDKVWLWDMSDPARAVPPGRPLTGPKAYVESVAFSPDGKTLAAGTEAGTVWLWNVTRPARPVAFSGMPLTGSARQVSGVTFSPDGRLLAACSQDKKVWLWRLSGAGGGGAGGGGGGGGGAGAAGGVAVADGTLTGATSWVDAVAFSPDGTSLAAGTSDASVLVWNMATRALTATLPDTQPVTSVTWDGRNRIVSSVADGTVLLWTLPTPVLPTANAPSAVAYSPDGGTIAVGGQDVQIWNAATRELIATHALGTGTFVNGLAYSPDGRVLAVAYSDGTAGLLEARTLAPLSAPFRVSTLGNAETVAFSPDGTTLATGGDDGTVRLWSVADPVRPRQLSSVPDARTYVYTVVFAPDGKTLAAASVDNYTRLWDVADPAHPGELGKPLGGFASYAIGLAFSPNGSLLAIGSADRTVRLWNVTSPGRPVAVGAPLTGPSGYIWALAFSPDGRTLAGGVTDGSVWLWNLSNPGSPSLIATLTGPAGHVYSVAFAPAGGQLAASSDDGTVHLWDTDPATAQGAICANLGQPLTASEWSAYVPAVPYHSPCSTDS
jgi:WD40 repeat protein/transcriptional regulator with XRE-family HTH domain